MVTTCQANFRYRCVDEQCYCRMSKYHASCENQDASCQWDEDEDGTDERERLGKRNLSPGQRNKKEYEKHMEGSKSSRYDTDTDTC